MEKDNEIQLTKNKMDLNNQKMTNHPPSPALNKNIYKGTKKNISNLYISLLKNQKTHELVHISLYYIIFGYYIYFWL